MKKTEPKNYLPFDFGPDAYFRERTLYHHQKGLIFRDAVSKAKKDRDKKYPKKGIIINDQI